MIRETGSHGAACPRSWRTIWSRIGGEAGPDPWEYVNMASRHQVGAVTFGTGSVGATEGDAWFAGERTEAAVSIATFTERRWWSCMTLDATAAGPERIRHDC